MGTLTLLIVDDETNTREGLARFIDWAQCGIGRVETAANGLEALVFVRNNRVDIIVSDIKMPEMDGMEFVTAVRKLHCDAGVIFLSAYATKKNLLKCFDLKVINFLEKPVNRQALYEAVEAIAEAGATGQAAGADVERPSDYGYISNRIVEYIRENFTDSSLSIEVIARAVYMTDTYVCAVFKRQTGMTIGAYISKLRMQKAYELITETSMKVNAVASAVGYVSMDHFTRLFKKHRGMTPTEARKKAASGVR